MQSQTHFAATEGFAQAAGHLVAALAVAAILAAAVTFKKGLGRLLKWMFPTVNGMKDPMASLFGLLYMLFLAGVAVFMWLRLDAGEDRMTAEAAVLFLAGSALFLAAGVVLRLRRFK